MSAGELLAALEAYPIKDGTQAVLELIEDARKNAFKKPLMPLQRKKRNAKSNIWREYFFF